MLCIENKIACISDEKRNVIAGRYISVFMNSSEFKLILLYNVAKIYLSKHKKNKKEATVIWHIIITHEYNLNEKFTPYSHVKLYDKSKEVLDMVEKYVIVLKYNYID